MLNWSRVACPSWMLVKTDERYVVDSFKKRGGGADGRENGCSAQVGRRSFLRPNYAYPPTVSRHRKREREKSTVMQQRQDEGQRGFLSSPAQPAFAVASIIVSLLTLPLFLSKVALPSKRRKRRMSTKVRKKRERERETREESSNFFSFFIHPRCRHSVGRLSVRAWTDPSLPHVT